MACMFFQFVYLDMLFCIEELHIPSGAGYLSSGLPINTYINPVLKDSAHTFLQCYDVSRCLVLSHVGFLLVFDRKSARSNRNDRLSPTQWMMRMVFAELWTSDMAWKAIAPRIVSWSDTSSSALFRGR